MNGIFKLGNGKLQQMRFWLLLPCLVWIYLAGMQVDLMEIDAAQYASISREMNDTGSYLEVYHRGQDYLDKPPLLFWLSSLSIKYFGLHNWSYKLPSVLAFFLGIYALFRFTRNWYGTDTAVLAALIMATAAASLLMTSDVRTDALLTAWVMCAVWQLDEFLRTRTWLALILAGTAIGLAMMSKGPVGLIIPAVAVGGHLLLRRGWKQLFDWRWLILLTVVAVLLLPMCIGLYQQFDLHPEKEVYGLQGPSGIRFFFWTQSFGRITGESDWQNHPPPGFLLQSFLVGFLPWALLFIPAFISLLVRIIRKRFHLGKEEEGFTISAWLLMLIAFSLSAYQLPHYVYCLVPFASVILADHLHRFSRMTAWLAVPQFVLNGLLLLGCWLVVCVVFPERSILLVLTGTLVTLFVFFSGKWRDQVVSTTLTVAITAGIILHVQFYPALLQYQSTDQAGRYIREQQLPEGKVYFYNTGGHSLDFYADRIVPQLFDDEVPDLESGTIVFTSMQQAERLETMVPAGWEVLEMYSHFPVSRLQMTFLDPRTRDQVLGQTCLLRRK